EAVIARGLVWKTNVGSPPTLEDNEGTTIEGSGIGAFTSTMASLANFSNYAVRAYATNSAGTAYGDTKYFWTLVGPPAVTTVDITNIDAHVATGGGEVTDFGGSTSLDGVGVVWSTTPNPDISDVNSYDGFSQIYPFSPTSDNPFEILLSGLEPDTKYYVRAFAGNAHSTAYGQEITFTTGSFSTQTGSFEDARDNTQYSTVTISGQTWMAENLAYLPEVCAPDADCGYWVYDYSGTDVNAAKAESNYTTYGVLYNWEMASTSCPAGWHLPSRSEWSIFEMNLVLEYNWAIGHVRPNDSDQGGKIKETGTTHWDSPNAGATNISGFTALPGGRLYDLNNTFENIQSHGYFWASDTPITEQAFFRHVRWDYTKILAENRPPEGGYSVRCLQDQ
ncbi:MAG: fibrobacter succinogenes major paralogous domain-containing protein, partial [Cyclobacteriaceae bacterium]|nr:fibrobacter succinogenes major paralogous domain-containing protein [Cyclobacteriaceae bacterium]